MHIRGDDSHSPQIINADKLKLYQRSPIKVAVIMEINRKVVSSDRIVKYNNAIITITWVLACYGIYGWTKIK